MNGSRKPDSTLLFFIIIGRLDEQCVFVVRSNFNLFVFVTDGLAVMSVDLGSQFMKVAIVKVNLI